MSTKSGEIKEPRETRSRQKSASVKGAKSSLVSDIGAAFEKQMATKKNENKTKKTENKVSAKAKSLNIENNANTQEEDLSEKTIDQLQLEQEKTNCNHDNDTTRIESLNAENQDQSETCIHAENAKDKGNTTTIEEQINEDEITEETPPDVSNREVLESLKELGALVQKLDNDIHHPKNGMSGQLVKLTLRMDDLYSDIHGAVGGLKPKLQQLEDSAQMQSDKMEAMEANQAKIVQLMNDMKKLTQDINLMKGMFQKHSQNLQKLENNILDLTRRGMEQNLIFHGIHEKDFEEGQYESCRETIVEFLEEKLQLSIDPLEIWKVHRMGVRKENRARAIVTKVSYNAKEQIMQNVTKLKDLKNKHQQKIFINEQIPEGVIERKKQVSSRLKKLRKDNDQKPINERSDIKVMNDKIIIDGMVDTPEVKTPQPEDLFMDPVELKMVRALNSKILETRPINVQNSQFIGFAFRAHSTLEVNRAYKAIALRFPSVDHIMMAYGLKEDDQLKIGHCDDGEFSGGNCIQQTLKEMKVRNTAVFIVRKYGGIHLGFERFATIQKVTKEALKLLRGG